MSEQCFCHLNGYAVKDSTARQEIEALKTKEVIDTTARSEIETLKTTGGVDSYARQEIETLKTKEVVDTTARSAILGLEEDIETLQTKEVVDSTARATATQVATDLATHKQAEVIDSTARNSITGHETRITALESASGGSGGSSGSLYWHSCKIRTQCSYNTSKTGYINFCFNLLTNTATKFSELSRADFVQLLHQYTYYSGYITAGGILEEEGFNVNSIQISSASPNNQISVYYTDHTNKQNKQAIIESSVTFAFIADNVYQVL